MKGETVDLAILALRLSALGAANASSLGGLDEPTVKAMFRRLDNDLERIAELHEKEIAAHLAKAAQPVEAVPAAWRYVTPVGEWISRGLDEADFRIASEKGYEIQSRYEPAKPIEGVEDIRKAVEQAVTEHCNGSDLWLSTYLAAQCIAAALAHPRPAGDGMVSVIAEDANNYCRILTALGMEEEGDPVAEVERLMGLAESTPTGEQAGEVDIGVGRDIVKRLRDTPNWLKEAWGDFKSAGANKYDRAPKEAADYIETLLSALAHPRPTGEQAGEVVAYRLVSKHKPTLSGAWQDGDVPDDLNEAGVSKTHTIQRAYAQPRPAGVPGGEVGR